MNQQLIHPSALPREQLLAQCDVERLRRSGPGGQHRNKVETAIRLSHRPSGVTAMASERRSQSANLSQAIFRLRVNLALSVRTTREAGPSLLWKKRCIGGRVLINPQHDDFPEILAELMDYLSLYQWDMSQTAAVLECTVSQLVKVLRQESRAFEQINEERKNRDLKPLR